MPDITVDAHVDSFMANAMSASNKTTLKSRLEAEDAGAAASAQAAAIAEAASATQRLQDIYGVSQLFNHTLDYSFWNKAAKMVFTKTTAPNFIINVGGGATHVKMLRWDGSYSAVKAVSGNTSVSAADWGAAPTSPYNSRMPKFGAIVPCNSGGSVLGDITYLACILNSVTSLDVSGLTSLTYLSMYGNNLTSLDLSGLTSLTSLNLYGNNLTSLDVSGLTSLTSLNCSNNNLTSIDVSGLTSLSFVSLENLNVTSLTLSGLTSLSYLAVSSNDNLTSLDVSGLTSLANMYCSSCENLTSVDISNCVNLEYLLCNNNPNLTSIRAVNCKFGGYAGYWSPYPAELVNCALDLDAVWQLLTDMAVADDTSDRIVLTGNPCDAGGGPAFDETGQTHTAAEVLALMDAKDYDITLTGGTIVHS